VGLFEFATYETVELQLPPRFIMALISDGILEVLPQPRLRDKLRFLLSLISNDSTTIAAVVRELALNQENTLPDDITFLMIQKRS
jgi:serine phosphatase RsbU (regulator of sigma subunit)